MKDLILPNIEIGLQKSLRTRADIKLACAVFVVTGRTTEEMQNNTVMAKSQIAFYASTPSYSTVMEMHGWSDLAARLNAMSREGRWTEMWQEISDDMLDEFAVVAPLEDLPHNLKERYDGLLDRVGFYFPFEPDDADKKAIWESAAKVFAI